MFSFKGLINKKNRPLVMGILNITPDSFSDGGEANSLSSALERLNKLSEQGADIIDIGACSTAPKNEPVSLEEELKRLEILPELVKSSKVPLSIDTFRPEIAHYALENGVCIVNDESGKFSEGMANEVKIHSAGWIFMHTGGKTSNETAEYKNGAVNDVLKFFESMKKQAIAYGISEDSLCYDCGIGFGKTRDEDLQLLSECKKLSRYSPLLVGVSRKRVIGEILNKENPKERIIGSVAAATVCTYNGAQILRVHDVTETLDAIKVAYTIIKGHI